MELSDLLRVLRRQRAIAVLVAAFVVVVGALAAYTPASRYKATTTLLAQPNPDQLQFSSIQAVQFLMPALAEQVRGRSFATAAVRRLPANQREGPGSKVTSEADPASGILRISIESTDQAYVAPAANAWAQELVAANPARELLTIAVLDPARTPGVPFAPARKPIVFASLVLALIAGGFAALAAEGLRRRLDRADEIRQRLGTDVLGEIPVFNRLRKTPATTAALFGEYGNAQVVEAFQRLRTNLEIVLLQRRPHAICVTSSFVGEGKTTVSASTGWVLTSVGHRITVIDADLRRPALHRLLGQAPQPGVADAILGPVDPLFRKTDQPSLQFVAAGVPDRHPAEVVSIALPRVLEEAARRSDLAIVDAPPLNGAAEAALVAAMTRAVILVVDARRNDPDEVERSLAQLRQTGADILGVVLTRARIRRNRRTAEHYYIADVPKRAADAPRRPAARTRSARAEPAAERGRRVATTRPPEAASADRPPTAGHARELDESRPSEA